MARTKSIIVRLLPGHHGSGADIAVVFVDQIVAVIYHQEFDDQWCEIRCVSGSIMSSCDGDTVMAMIDDEDEDESAEKEI